MSSVAVRLRRAVVLSMTLAVAALGGAVLAPAQAHAASEPGVQIAELTNQARADNGAGALLYSDQLEEVAQSWAEQMAASASLQHNPNVADQVPAGWTNIGENIAMGTGTPPEGMHEMWMGSTGHFQNIVNPAFTVMGVGYTTAADGTAYAVEVFAKYPDAATAGAQPVGAAAAPQEPAAPPAAPAETEAPAPEPEAATTEAPAEPEATPVAADPQKEPAAQAEKTPAATRTSAAAEPTSTATPAAAAAARLSSTGVDGLLFAGLGLSGVLAVVSGIAFLAVYRNRRSTA